MSQDFEPLPYEPAKTICNICDQKVKNFACQRLYGHGILAFDNPPSSNVRFNLTVFGASLYRILYFARLFPCTVYKVSERPSKVTVLFLIHSNAIQSMLENEGGKVKQSKMYFK